MSRASFAVLSHVTPAGSPRSSGVVHTGETLDRIPELAKLVPPERRASCAIVDIRPTGHYLTYGLGVPLPRLRDPERSRARIPVG